MEPTQKLMPFYLVVDVSSSMGGAKAQAANNMVLALVDALAANPILSDKIRFGMLQFATDARVLLPLCDPLDSNTVFPALAVGGATAYAPAFRLLRSEIEANVKQLKADGFAVHRPTVFFLSDGSPTDQAEWQQAFDELTGIASYPNVVPFGVSDADRGVLRSLIHPATGQKRMRMFLMDEGEDAAQAISGMAEVLISSVLASGSSMAAGASGIILPENDEVPSGITAYGADDFV
jgi:uncharacterized protein YegL